MPVTAAATATSRVSDDGCELSKKNLEAEEEAVAAAAAVAAALSAQQERQTTRVV